MSGHFVLIIKYYYYYKNTNIYLNFLLFSVCCSFIQINLKLRNTTIFLLHRKQ